MSDVQTTVRRSRTKDALEEIKSQAQTLLEMIDTSSGADQLIITRNLNGSHGWTVKELREMLQGLIAAAHR